MFIKWIKAVYGPWSSVITFISFFFFISNTIFNKQIISYNWIGLFIIIITFIISNYLAFKNKFTVNEKNKPLFKVKSTNLSINNFFDGINNFIKPEFKLEFNIVIDIKNTNPDPLNLLFEIETINCDWEFEEPISNIKLNVQKSLKNQYPPLEDNPIELTPRGISNINIKSNFQVKSFITPEDLKYIKHLKNFSIDFIIDPIGQKKIILPVDFELDNIRKKFENEIIVRILNQQRSNEDTKRLLKLLKLFWDVKI